MDTKRRLLIAGVGLGGLLAVGGVLAPRFARQPEAIVTEEVSRPLLMRDGRIVVTEFFSFGCPHCANMAPLLKPWVQDLPERAVFEKRHVSFGVQAWTRLGTIYYALESLGLADAFADQIFAEIQANGPRGFMDDHGAAWFAARGVARDQFKDALQRAPDALAGADAQARRVGIESIPIIVIGDRFTILGGSHQQTLDLARAKLDQLIAEGLNA